MKHMPITSLLPVTNKFSWRQRRKGDFPRRGLDFCVVFGQPWIQEKFKVQCFTEQRYLGRRCCFPGGAAPRSLCTFLPAELSQSHHGEIKEDWKKLLLVQILIRALEPCGACRNKGRTHFSPSLWTAPLVCGHLDLQQCFYGGFLYKSLARPSWGMQWPQEHSVWFCLAPSKWESLW